MSPPSPNISPPKNKVKGEFQAQLLNLSKTGIYVNNNRIKGIGGSRPKKVVFVHFDICYSPIFLLSKMVSQLSKLFVLWVFKSEGDTKKYRKIHIF